MRHDESIGFAVGVCFQKIFAAGSAIEIVWILCGLVEAKSRTKTKERGEKLPRGAELTDSSLLTDTHYLLPHHVIRPHRLHQPLPPYRLPIPTSLRRKGWTGRGRPRRVRRAQQGHGMVPRRSNVGGTVSFGKPTMLLFICSSSPRLERCYMVKVLAWITEGIGFDS